MGSPAVQFDEASHTYRIGERVVPSVTQILEPLFDFQRIDPDVLAYKALLGAHVHDACELVIYDDLDDNSLRPELVGYVDAFRAWLAESGFQAEATEEIVVSSRYGFAVPGRLDLVGTIRGWRWVIDIKTATAINVPAARLQTAAYAAAYAEQVRDERLLVHKRGALQLKPDGKYKLHRFDGDHDLAAFLNLHQFNNWRSLYDC